MMIVSNEVAEWLKSNGFNEQCGHCYVFGKLTKMKMPLDNGNCIYTVAPSVLQPVPFLEGKGCRFNIEYNDASDIYEGIVYYEGEQVKGMAIGETSEECVNGLLELIYEKVHG